MRKEKDIRCCLLKTETLVYGSNVEKNEDLNSEFNRRLLDSVRKDGIKEPILVINGPKGPKHVKVGNTRLWAARTLGIKEIPCIVVTLEVHISKCPIPDGRVVENIHDEFKMPIHWTERKNYVALKCTHTHLDHKEVV